MWDGVAAISSALRSSSRVRTGAIAGWSWTTCPSFGDTDAVQLWNCGRETTRRATRREHRYTPIATLHFEISGAASDAQVERAIGLSREKSCSVWNSLNPDIMLRISTNLSRPAAVERQASRWARPQSLCSGLFLEIKVHSRERRGSAPPRTGPTSPDIPASRRSGAVDPKHPRGPAHLPFTL